MPLYVSANSLLQLPVQTESGVALGRVVDAELDTEDLHLERIKVQPKGLTGLLQKEFLIHRSQIVRIEERCVIVDDACVSKTETSKQPSPDVA